MLFGKKNKPSAALNPGPENNGIWQRLQNGLQKTRSVLSTDLSGLFSGNRTIDDAMLEEIESRLIMADVGMETAAEIIDALKREIKKSPAMDHQGLITTLREQMLTRLLAVEAPLSVTAAKNPFVILIVGVNGAGKTTTIGKLAGRLVRDGKSVLLAAGDTFRAAAIEQIQSWGEKIKVPVIAQKHGADAAAVVYDALVSARSRGMDVVIADTAGRLHTKSNLMEEMKKIRRIIQRFDADIPVETLLVLDAGTGQNAIAQAQQFDQAVGVTGIALTKLDGSARGGIVFALTEQLGKPLRFIGVGEQAEDLQVFDAEAYVDALLGDEA